ncbi:MAG: undecaprenyldiphospho-muramoylpentapeptide beta-N-acetylglucosaminyltransferase [Polyangiaceae bacterium]|nr:undecaprenyldiphospho-muramoylpentapeptide beta-N-acetylglucosaminyltransferase [Polyangiaceae bacterium]
MTVLIAGGGTGGHVFPMLAVGQALRRASDEVDVFYVGTERGLEARVMPQAGEDLELLDVAPLRGGGLKGFMKGAAKAVASLKASRDLVRRRRPDVVLSVGGYAGGPIALAARAMGVPLAVLEPNSVLGLTNRWLGPFAHRAYVAFGDVDKRFRKHVAIRSGVPLRNAFAPKPYKASHHRFHVLVLGGSLGAKALNERLPEAFSALQALVPHATIVHQTGRGNSAETWERYLRAGVGDVSARVTDFIDGVADELGRADVVIQRCGASSLAELCLVGRASVLVPFPFAADQHQLANARSLERAGAAVALEQSEATSERLANELMKLAADPDLRARMAMSAATLATPDAADTIARDLLSLATGKASAQLRAREEK